MKVRRDWILKNWIELIQKGMTPDELLVIYWRDVEGFEFKKAGSGVSGTRERARQLYARARRKLKAIAKGEK